MTHDNTVAITTEQRAQLRRAAAQELGFLVLSGDYDLVARDHSHVPTVALPDAADAGSLVQAVLAVGRARKETLDALRQALQLPNNQATALQLARQLVNLPTEVAHASEKVH